MKDKVETIKLSFPTIAAYISSVRLTTSSIATRMNFGIDEIEGIKSAVSEGCIFFIKKLNNKYNDDFTINFTITKSSLTIHMSIYYDESIDIIEDDISVILIESLVDDFKISHDNSILKFNLIKNIK